MKLIKINEEHYVIVDDTKINVGDWITDKYRVWKWNDDCSLLGRKKITHSTQPLNDKPHYADYKMLFLPAVKELIGVVDVEKKVEILYPSAFSGIWNNENDKKEHWIKGYNQAIEDNKEKKYTNEDMLTIRNQLVTMLPVGDVAAWDMIQAISKYTKWLDEYIQSLQPKTEWEVEIINGKLKLK